MVNLGYNVKSLHSSGGETALTDAISEYNNSNYTVKGTDGQYYKVKFEITAVAVEETDIQTTRVKYSMKDNAGTGDTKETNFPYGNVIGSDIEGMRVDQNNPDELGSASFNTISLNTEGIDRAVSLGYDIGTTLFNFFIHEIGHNIGGAHEDAGAMEKNVMVTSQSAISINGASSTAKYTQRNKLTKNNVEKIIGTIWGGGRASGRSGQIKKVDEK